MRIFDKITQLFVTAKEKREAKRKEKLLIETDDDELVVNLLPAEKDNFHIDIHKVVKTMQDSGNMTEVVKNNLEEIMVQDKLRDTLKELEDAHVLEVIEESKETLQEQGKIVLAIKAIDDKEKRLEATEENLKYLTTSETASVLSSVKESHETKKARELEHKKIKLASEQILRMLVKYGHVSQVDIKEMIATLQEESSKLTIIKLCLFRIKEYDSYQKRNITEEAKCKMVYNLLKMTDVDISKKYKFMNDSIMKTKLLSFSESNTVMQKLESDKNKQEKEERERMSRLKSRPKGGEEYE